MKNLYYTIITLIIFGLSSLNAQADDANATSIKYLSGRGSGDMVQWDFYCTDGLNSGKWTKIGVPSCWDVQGFGHTQYGFDYNTWNMFPPTTLIADETGYYKYSFSVPQEWADKQVEIVFEASMTDTEVKVNGHIAGSVHQGGFSPFRYDISDKLHFDGKENLLEVKVNKESSNNTMNLAQRRCDFWNFGGIIRPVYLVAKPKRNIERVAIDADMHGRFRADCFLKNVGKGWKLKVSIFPSQSSKDAKGIKPIASLTQEASDTTLIDFTPLPSGEGKGERLFHLWSAETPYLYTAEFSLIDPQGKVVHQEKQKFGFRTIEVKEKDGVYVNGRKIMFKGVNRDSFDPETGRTLSKQKNIEDVKLIKSMNMNAVRLNDYPADPDFYDACDSLGLYVLAELSGWQTPQETPIGKRLVREMVTRDVNHPSIVFWCSGNEGGFNYELEPEFRKYDIQKRTILYPWSETKNGIRTRHYRSYDEVKKYLETGDIFMPTEFLHGLYDGGIGAGLNDYWQLMKSYSNSAGGFLWCLADEGLVRKDLGGKIDCKGNLAADGIVGPHHEKEGSYYTVKQLWSPIQLAYNNGELTITNDYDFRTLKGCKIVCEWLKEPNQNEKDNALSNHKPQTSNLKSQTNSLKSQTIGCKALQPKQNYKLKLPKVKDASILRLTTLNAEGDTLFVYGERLRKLAEPSMQYAAIKTSKDIDRLNVTVGEKIYSFSETNGQLKHVVVNGKAIHFGNGPRFIAARRADRGRRSVKAGSMTEYRSYLDNARFTGFTIGDSGKVVVNYKGGYIDHVEWTFLKDGSVKVDVKYSFNKVVDLMGVMFDYPEKQVLSKSWLGNGPYRVWQNRLVGPQYGYWHNKYNNPIPAESFDYPEFKGYFSNVDKMQIETTEGNIGIVNLDSNNYVGVYKPEDGRDNFLYRLPDTGISILKYIPAVRNKIDYSDKNGPSAQPHTAKDSYECSFILLFK